MANQHPGLVHPIDLPAYGRLDLDTDHDFGVWHYYAHDRVLATTTGGYEYWIEQKQ